MRIMYILALVPLLASATAQTQSAQPAGQNKGSPQAQSQQPIQQQVRKNLQQAGFTDIQLMPSSFLVRAKDKNGNQVMMVINPDSVTAVTEVPAASTTGQGSGNGQPHSGASSSGSNNK